MNDLIKSFYGICDNSIILLSKYYSHLDKTSEKDRKTYTSEHYSFLGKLLEQIEEIDGLLAAVSLSMSNAHSSDDSETITPLTELFEHITALREAFNDYLETTEAALKQDDGSLSYVLKNQTDILIRRISMVSQYYKKTNT